MHTTIIGKFRVKAQTETATPISCQKYIKSNYRLVDLHASYVVQMALWKVSKNGYTTSTI